MLFLRAGTRLENQRRGVDIKEKLQNNDITDMIPDYRNKWWEHVGRTERNLYPKDNSE
jgi:hypothetical protein